VLFRASRGDKLRLTPSVLRTYGFVSLLHALWDLAPALALSLTLYTTGRGWQLNLLGQHGPLKVIAPGAGSLYKGLDDVILVLIAAVGLLTVHRLRKQALRRLAGETG
jgi:hypothetical protein